MGGQVKNTQDADVGMDKKLALALMAFLVIGCINTGTPNQDEPTRICKRISDSEFRERCLELVQGGNGSACTQYEEYESKSIIDKCYSEFAQARKNPDLCEKIYDASARDICLGWVAELSNDTGICERISHEDAKYNCIAYVHLARSECGLIANETLQEECYADSSMTEAELSANITQYEEQCEQSGTLATRDDCYSDLAQVTKSDGYCRNIVDVFSRDECYTFIVMDTGNQSICKKVSAQEQEGCYANAAVANKNPEICDNYTTPGMGYRDACYYMTALEIAGIKVY